MTTYPNQKESRVIIQPHFYRVDDPNTEKTKGYLLGSIHGNSSEIMIYKRTLQEYFSPNSFIQRAFQASEVFAFESTMFEHFCQQTNCFNLNKYSLFVHKEELLDGIFEVTAIRNHKLRFALESNMETESYSRFHSDLNRTTPISEKCHREMIKFIYGDTSRFEYILANCLHPSDVQTLNKRNRIMASRASVLFDQYISTFVMVGSSHLPGKGGICQKLEEKGWRVTRIPIEKPEDQKPSRMLLLLNLFFSIMKENPSLQRNSNSSR